MWINPTEKACDTYKMMPLILKLISLTENLIQVILCSQNWMNEQRTENRDHRTVHCTFECCLVQSLILPSFHFTMPKLNDGIQWIKRNHFECECVAYRLHSLLLLNQINSLKLKTKFLFIFHFKFLINSRHPNQEFSLLIDLSNYNLWCFKINIFNCP